jgi:DNA modification methylase
MPKFNDLDLNNWKNLDIWTDSLWVINERDKSGKHSGYYHGNFVPQIPRQLILRYSKKDDVVLDPFVGSGTTAFEAETLKRNFIGIDIQGNLTKEIETKLDSKDIFFELITGDSTSEKVFDKVKNRLAEHKRKNVQLVILHPPYHDIIKFSGYKEDLSNVCSLREFLDKFGEVVKNSVRVLEKGRYLAIVIGDKYSQSKWIPLGFYCMYEANKLGLTLKSIVVKNMEGNRGKHNQQAIWKYRALANDYYIFKHEYIFIFKN